MDITTNQFLLLSTKDIRFDDGGKVVIIINVNRSLNSDLSYSLAIFVIIFSSSSL